MAFVICFENRGLRRARVAAEIAQGDLRSHARAFAWAQHHPPIIHGIFLEQ